MRAALTRLPRYPPAKWSLGYRSAPAGFRRAKCALLRPGASLLRTGGASGRASIRSRPDEQRGFLQPSKGIDPPFLALLPGLSRSDVSVSRRGGQNLKRRRALVDNARIGVPHGRADADLGALAPGCVEHAGFGLAARGRAAEQSVDRLLLGVPGAEAGGARDRWGQAEIGRNDQRRIARNREFVGRSAPALEQRAAAGRDGGDQKSGRHGPSQPPTSPRGHAPFAALYDSPTRTAPQLRRRY